MPAPMTLIFSFKYPLRKRVTYQIWSSMKPRFIQKHSRNTQEIIVQPMITKSKKLLQHRPQMIKELIFWINNTDKRKRIFHKFQNLPSWQQKLRRELLSGNRLRSIIQTIFLVRRRRDSTGPVLGPTFQDKKWDPNLNRTLNHQIWICIKIWAKNHKIKRPRQLTFMVITIWDRIRLKSRYRARVPFKT